MAPEPAPIKHKTIRHIDGQRHARFLTFSCYQNRPLLRHEHVKRLVLDSIDAARERYTLDVWAFVLMPTHVHLLVLPLVPETRISKVLASLKLYATRRAIPWAREHARPLLREMTTPAGAFKLWQRGPGYDRNLSSPRRMWDAIDYIHMNPVADNLCQHPLDYAWSSAAAYAPREDVGPPIPVDRRSVPRDPR